MMKPKNRTISLVLALMLLCGAAAAQGTAPAAAEMPFVFCGGITWDMTIEQMKEAMSGVTDGESYGSERGDRIMVGYENIEHNGETLSISCYFKNGRMATATWFYPEGDGKSFAMRLEELTQEYGEPMLTDRAEAAALFAALRSSAYDESNITQLAGWTLSDGTRMYLFDLDGYLSLYHFNAPFLLANEPE